MKTLKITRAANKANNNKIIQLNEETNIAKMGRTYYTVQLSSHQPNIEIDDYGMVNYKIEDLKPITLFNINNKNATGIIIYNYTINE